MSPEPLAASRPAGQVRSGTNSLAYQGIFRVFRNAVVGFMRDRLQQVYGDGWEAAIQKPFQKEWEQLVANAEGARRAGTIEGPVRDAADYLSVNHFYNLFDAQFPALWPELAGDQDAKTALLHWARGIKLVRDFVAHPAELDLAFSDAYVLLDNARRILTKIDASAAARIAQMQTQLLQQPEPRRPPVQTYLPPRENIVLDSIGRRDLLADLHQWFGDPLRRRWLLAGTDGGRGKSALAYEFAEQIVNHRPHDLALVAWLSAKERQFQHGHTLPLQPDFTDLESAIDKLLFAYGIDAKGYLDTKRVAVLQQLTELPALIIVDDVDSLAGQAEQAIEFFTIDAASTRSKVLFTARRVPLGLGATVTHVGPFSYEDAVEFVESRIRMYGIDRDRLSDAAITRILELTDRSPLYLEDLLLLCRNISPSDAMNGWAKNRGSRVREYALKREVELLTPLARRLLIACGLSEAPVSLGELEILVNVTRDEAVDGLTELGTYYLVPQPRVIEDEPRYALNANTKRLVQEGYARSPEGRSIQAALDHAFGGGAGPEAEHEVASICRHAVVLLSGGRQEDAAALLNEALTLASRTTRGSSASSRGRTSDGIRLASTTRGKGMSVPIK